jgi:hypothetical protein
MRLPPELLRILGIHHELELELECPEDRAKRERFEQQQERHLHALAHVERVIADVRRAERLIEEHRW